MYDDGIPASCDLCRIPGSDDLRREWGCDADLPEGKASFSTLCAECFGGDPRCKACSGAGSIARKRCPSVEMGSVCPSCTGMDPACRECHGRYSPSSDMMELMNAYSMLDRFQVLPGAGGTLDQHPRFLQAVRLIETERGRISKAQLERERSARRASRAEAKRKGRKRG